MGKINFGHKIKLKLSLLILLLMGIFLSFCNKEAKHYYISEEFKSWCSFNKGSYWIYQNDSTLIQDSLFLTKDPSILDVPYRLDKGAPTYQHITILFMSQFFNQCRLVTGPGGLELLDMIIYSNEEPLGLVATPTQYFVPSWSNIPDGGYKTLVYDSTFTIGSVKYLNVVHTQFSYDGKLKKYNFSFAKHVGLIKFVFESSDSTVSWSLIRHYVVQ